MDENRQHIVRLKNLMWQKVGHYSNEMDVYASQLFERPIRGSWRIFVYVAKHGVPDNIGGNPWYWESMSENPHYPPQFEPNFELFASIYLHEVAHGWCHLLKDYELGERRYFETGTFWVYADDREEEDICWEISRLVCRLLNISFDEAAIP